MFSFNPLQYVRLLKRNGVSWSHCLKKSLNFCGTILVKELLHIITGFVIQQSIDLNIFLNKNIILL